MINLNSARVCEETPHISDALKQRAQSVINDKSIDAQTRAIIRYGLEINDPWLPDLIRCVDAGETIIENFFVASTEEKIERLTHLICRAGDEPSAALLVFSQPSKTPPTPTPSPTPQSTLRFNAAPN